MKAELAEMFLNSETGSQHIYRLVRRSAILVDTFVRVLTTSSTDETRFAHVARPEPLHQETKDRSKETYFA